MRLINRHPSRPLQWLLGLLPFVILVIVYMGASQQRLAENPNDKLLPGINKMVTSMERLAFEPSKRSGEYLFWQDTSSSLQRLAMGVGISALIGLLIGLTTGAFPLARANLSPLVTAIALIPPMAILPILFIIFGLGEVSKVVLIIIGIAPFIIRDMQARTLEIPSEQIIKAQTLNANSWQILLRVLLPQILPRLLDTVRLSLGAAWIFLIAAEAIAATDGLGYRIFLVRRYLSMDVILPYVVWITCLAFLIDWFIRVISMRAFPWYHSQKAQQGH